jgi:predicted dehydrogenase
LKKIKWGFIGTGFIAKKFAEGLKVIPDAELHGVVSRLYKNSKAFAKEYRVKNAYHDIPELLSDPEIDVVYIATPHNFHKKNVLDCISANKAVLCEKPMGINSKEVEEMVSFAREKDLFLMEALWMKYLPVFQKVLIWLDEDRIGEPRLINVNFGFRTEWIPEGRLLNTAFAGGAIMDIGIYGIAIASSVFQKKPSEIRSLSNIGQTGVDEQTAVILKYESDGLATLNFAIRTDTAHQAYIFGTEGYIFIPDFWRCTEAELITASGDTQSVNIPFIGSGYNYEAEEVMECLRQNKKESSIMPLDESISIMRIIDKVRAQIELKFPGE